MNLRCLWLACVWIIICGSAAIFKMAILLKCLASTQCTFSECLLLHLVKFCGLLTKFPAELNAKTLLLQHIQFIIWRRHKHTCTVDQLAHNSVNLSHTALVCSVRRHYPNVLCGCHFDTVSSFCIKNFILDIFDQLSSVCVCGWMNDWMSVWQTNHGPIQIL